MLLVHFTFILLLIAGVTVPILSVVAVVADRFNRVMAGITALAAGLPPLLFAFMWNFGRLRGQKLQLYAMLGSGPLFLISFFLYGVGISRSSSRTLTVPAIACSIGIFAGVGYSLVLVDFLSRMP